jgi:hypothetical protein
MRNFKNIMMLLIISLIPFGCSKINDDPSIPVIDQKELGVKAESPEIMNKYMISKEELLKLTLKSGIPSSVDLSNYIPPVGDQAQLGTCVGWAVGYYAKTFQEKLEENWDITLSNNQFSPSWVYNQAGPSLANALNLLVNKGCDTKAHFPYNETNTYIWPNESSYAWAWHYKAASFYSLPNDVNTIKSILASGNVVIFRFEVFPDLDNLNSDNQIYDNCNGRSRGGHACCMVGYDDTKQAFKFVNSWGVSRGTWKDEKDYSKGKGYGWISYNMIKPWTYSIMIDPLTGIPYSVLTDKLLFQSYVLIDKKNESLNIMYNTLTQTGNCQIGYSKLSPYAHWQSDVPQTVDVIKYVYEYTYKGSISLTSSFKGPVSVTDNEYVHIESCDYTANYAGIINRVK